MEIDPKNLQNLVQRQMYEDPSGGVFNMRVMLQFFQMSENTNMTEGERASLFDLLHVIALKFAHHTTILRNPNETRLTARDLTRWKLAAPLPMSGAAEAGGAAV
jgi:hypothetical protein